MSPRARLGVKILGVGIGSLILLALGFVAAEIAVRYRERHRSTVPGTMPTLFYPHYRLRHALVRNTNYYGWMTVNADGFRGPPVTLTKDNVDTRIMVVGGSTTFDSFVEDGDSAAWPARLQHWLTAADTIGEIEVINAGVPGYRVLDNLIRLQLELYEYAPDVIIMYQSHNDLFTALSGRPESGRRTGDRPGEIGPTTPWSRWLTRRSLFYSKLMARFAAIRSRLQRAPAEPCAPNCAPDPPQAGDPGLDRAVAAFERDVRAFVVVAQSYGTRVVLLEPQHISGAGSVTETDSEVQRWWAQAVGVPTERTLTGYVRLAEALQRVAQETGAVYLSTRSFGITGNRYYVDQDPIHFNSAGADRMGRLVADQLRQTILADSAAVPVPIGLAAVAGTR